MKTVAQALPADSIDTLVEQIAPVDMHSEELIQFKSHLGKLDSKQLHSLHEEMKATARGRGRKIILRERLMSRLGTDWLRKQQEIVEGELAKIEVSKDTIDFNVLELELTSQTWRLDRITDVPLLEEQTGKDPMLDMIKRQQVETEQQAFGLDGALDEEHLEDLFGLR